MRFVGLGTGLMGIVAAEDEASAQREAQEMAFWLDQKDRVVIQQNYGAGTVPIYRSLARVENPLPSVCFEPTNTISTKAMRQFGKGGCVPGI